MYTLVCGMRMYVFILSEMYEKERRSWSYIHLVDCKFTFQRFRKKDKPRDYNFKENFQELMKFIASSHLRDAEASRQLGVHIISLPYCIRNIGIALKNASDGKKKV